MNTNKSLFAIAVLALGLTTSAQAQSLRNAGEPAEFPPSSFTGTQYVDSKGCVFVRVGSGPTTRWVPRVTRNRQQLCGFEPTNIAGAELPVIPDAPGTTAQTGTQTAQETQGTQPRLFNLTRRPQTTAQTTQPTTSVQSTSTAATSVRRVVTSSAPQTVTVRPSTPSPIQVVAPSAPAISSYAGKTIGEPGCIANETGQVFCNGRLSYQLKFVDTGDRVRVASGEQLRATAPTLVRVPVAPQASPVVTTPTQPLIMAARPTVVQTPQPTVIASAPQSVMTSPSVQPKPIVRQATIQPSVQPTAVQPTVVQTRTVQTAPAPQSYMSVAQAYSITPPAGYKPAWDDGRLNPYRGPRTELGNQQQQQIWTNTVPAKEVTATRARASSGGSVFSNPTVSTTQFSTMSDPAPTVAEQYAVTPQAAIGHSYVQIGTFGVSENATRATARVSDFGFPAATMDVSQGGKTYVVVLAGPFDQSAQTASALIALRSAGYKDAFTR